MTEDSRKLLNVALVGRYLSGKAALSRRFERDTFETMIPKTVAPDTYVKNVEVDGIKLRLQIWGLYHYQSFFHMHESLLIQLPYKKELQKTE